MVSGTRDNPPPGKFIECLYMKTGVIPEGRVKVNPT